MKILGKLAAATALALAMASGPATLAVAAPAPSPALAPPWAEDVTYWSGGVPVGGTRYYCDGRVISWGETGNYEYETWNFWFECQT